MSIPMTITSCNFDCKKTTIFDSVYGSADDWLAMISDEEFSDDFDLDDFQFDDEESECGDMSSPVSSEVFGSESADEAVEESFESDYVVPFWYEYDDVEYLLHVWRYYMNMLDVADTVGVRQYFIGRIERCQIEDFSGNFTTLDEVEIYSKLYNSAPSTPINLCEKHIIITSWDNEEGIPTKIDDITKNNSETEYYRTILKDTKKSFIHCFPDWKCFQYEISLGDCYEQMKYKDEDGVVAQYLQTRDSEPSCDPDFIWD
eukprot:TRINITY_DN1571_c0_g1_i3.p1 TRINITY_DN1571_c0_g1~~TRINITY_DN1571_c0_g1_i3.p1  ORF type:complete len:270 (-),score=58.48 TRINITY_DN1571_c0_g1_i3:90-866(-)